MSCRASVMASSRYITSLFRNFSRALGSFMILYTEGLYYMPLLAFAGSKISVGVRSFPRVDLTLYEDMVRLSEPVRAPGSCCGLQVTRLITSCC